MPRLPTSSQESARSIPRDSEEGRALLQSRLSRFGRLGAYLSFGFLLAAAGTALTLGNLPGTSAAATAQIASFTLSLGVARLRRTRPLAPTTLVAIDYAFTWLNCAIFVAFGFALPQYTRPELVQLCCVTDLLAARAFLVPSTARRTALIGLLPLLAIVVSTYVFYRAGPPHPDAPSALVYALLAAIMSMSPLVITAFTSRTIFGLREQAREALQLGQYTLLEKIGAGGMGIVYKARHATLRRPTAIKLLPADRAGAHNLARFEREVQLTCQLSHPNTIAIFDYGRSANGILYYAMEYLDGLDLESIVALTGPLPEARVVHVLLQVCGALGEAHAAGLMHRDIKPQNVLLCTRGGVHDVAKVVDFGLVKELARPGATSLSSTDMIVGTPLYMSPEAIVRPAELDARGDLYALGAVGYFLLTGTPPFRGSTVLEICGLQLHARPEPPSQRLGRAIMPELDALIMSCLEKAPDQRPASALLLATQLSELGLPGWTRAQAQGWWREHAAAIAAFRQQRSEAVDTAHTLPVATVAVDLREREVPLAPWQSSPAQKTPAIEG